jgi:hypothetical protein
MSIVKESTLKLRGFGRRKSSVPVLAEVVGVHAWRLHGQVNVLLIVLNFTTRLQVPAIRRLGRFCGGTAI